jgi:hypothetical protein
MEKGNSILILKGKLKHTCIIKIIAFSIFSCIRSCHHFLGCLHATIFPGLPHIVPSNVVYINVLSQFSIYEWIDFEYRDDVIVMFILLSMLMSKNHVFTWKFLFVNNIELRMFVGIIAVKPSRDFTHPLWMLRGLKGLLHMLNAIVSPMTVDLCFLFWFCFSFCFA